MSTHKKKAHKWVCRDWWDFKKLLEGISLGLFPTAPQCQSRSRRRDWSSKGRGEKKIRTHSAASQLKLNPFNYSPEVEAWGAKKELSSILLLERETPLLPSLKYPSEGPSTWGCLDVQVHVREMRSQTQQTTDWIKKSRKSHLCPEGLWTLLSQSHPCCPPHPQQLSLGCDP